MKTAPNSRGERQAKKPPDVSIIIPCFNADDTISDTLKSLQTQTLRNWEAVCVDDGSTDGTLQVLQTFAATDARIRWTRGPHRSPAAARNRGLAIAVADRALFLDADDLLMDNAALGALLGRAFVAGRESVVTGGYELLDAQSRPLSVFHFPTGWHFSVDSLLAGNRIPPMAMVSVSTLGHAPFDENPDKRGCEDWDLWLRLAHKGVGCVVIPRVLFGYRLRAGSLSHDPDRMFASARRVIEHWSANATDQRATRDALQKAACYFGAVGCASGANDAIRRYFQDIPPLDPAGEFLGAVAGGIRHAFQCVRGAAGQTWKDHAEEWVAECEAWLADSPLATHTDPIVEHLNRFVSVDQNPVETILKSLAQHPETRRLMIYGLGTNGLTLLHRLRHQSEGLATQLCIADDNADPETLASLGLSIEDPRRWTSWPPATVAIVTPHQPHDMIQTLTDAGGTEGADFVTLIHQPQRSAADTSKAGHAIAIEG